MRTSKILTSFVTSPVSERERLLYTSGMVADGFYSRHEYLITPLSIARFRQKCIVLPVEIGKVSQKYWKDGAWGGKFMPKKLTPRMWRETKDMIFPLVNQKAVKCFENEWKKIERETWKALSDCFPHEIKWIKSLEVRITKIGSYGSHYLLKPRKSQHLIISLREDSEVKEIVNLLVLALIYPQAEKLGLSFTKRMAIRNFILSRPVFKNLKPNFEVFDKKIPVNLRRRSDDYVKSLGIPNLIDPILEINKNLKVFGTKEVEVLLKLINNRGDILTYDDIADLIWGVGRFKSYWAINKLIQRVRKKIDSLNILLEIEGVRGRGYILK